LPPLPNHESSFAIGLNEQEVAVGRSKDLDSQEGRAVVWEVGAGVASVSELPGLNGETSLDAYDVNDDGMIAGVSQTLVGGSLSGEAVVWTGSPGNNVPHGLGTLGEAFVFSEAFAVSEADVNGNVWLAGWSGTDEAVSPPIRRAALWQVDAAGDLLSTIDLEPTATEARANDVRVIDGSVVIAGNAEGQAVIWETDLDGNLVSRSELSTASYQTTIAYSVNDSRHVVGQGFAAGQPADAYSFDGQSPTGLGTLGNSWSSAQAINDHDIVVGQYINVKTKGFYSIEDVAFIWQEGAMQNLIDQVSVRNFAYLYYAMDINNDNAIVGTGRLGKKLGSEQHGFLLIPESTDPPVNGGALYVYDISFDSRRGNKDWRAVFEIRTDSNANGTGDAGDSPIAGVQVEVIFAGSTYTGTTDSNGIFRTSWVRNLGNGDHYANAVDVALSGYSWDTMLDLEDDSDFILGPDALLQL
jgi:uncharacterized membrane protein